MAAITVYRTTFVGTNVISDDLCSFLHSIFNSKHRPNLKPPPITKDSNGSGGTWQFILQDTPCYDDRLTKFHQCPAWSKLTGGSTFE